MIRTRRDAGCLLAVALLTLTGLFGHESRQRTLRQNYVLQVDARNINIEVVTLFFFPREDPGDFGSSDLGERPIGAEELARSMGGNLKLQIDGQALPVFRLHRPELELSGSVESPRPRYLKMTFFARTPHWLVPGSRITVQNVLPGQAYPETVFRVEGRDGYHLSQEDLAQQLAGTPQGLVTWQATILTAPAGEQPPLEEAAVFTRWSSRLLLAWGLLTVAAVVVARRKKGRPGPLA